MLYVLELAGDRYVGGTPRGYGGMQLDAAGDIIGNTEDGVAALRAALTEPGSPSPASASSWAIIAPCTCTPPVRWPLKRQRGHRR